MDTLCILCGKPLDEGLTRCPHCGSGQSIAPETPAPPPPVPAQEPTPEVLPEALAPAKKKRSKWLLWSSIALVFVVLLAVLLFSLPSQTDRMIERSIALLSGNFDQIESIVPESVWDYYADKHSLSREELVSQTKQYYIQLLEKQYDEIFERKVTLLDQKTVDRETLAQICEALQERPYGQSLTVTEAKELLIWQKMSYTYGSQNNVLQLIAAKIDGQWYLMSLLKYSEDRVSVSFYITPQTSSYAAPQQ